MATLKIAVIGCGYWGKNLIRNFAQLGVLHAVCDLNPEVCEKTAKDYNVLAYNLEQTINSDVDGIVIATPAVTHFNIASKALNAGKHVFVEKPIALDLEEAKKLQKLALESQRTLMVGHLLQYHPAFLELKHIVTSGELGRLQYIYSNRLNFGKFRNEENILWSFAPHDISMILSLVGQAPDNVYATGICHLDQKIHDITTTHLTFKNGLQAHIFVSWLHPFKEQKLIVIGERGMAVFDDSFDWDQKLKIYPHKVAWINGLPQPAKADVINIPIAQQEPLQLECMHFLECVEGKHDKPRTDAKEGINVLQVLDAAERSLKSNTTINLHKNESRYFAHETAVIDANCEIGQGTKIWHFSHVLGGTKIGANCVIAQNVMLGPDVIVGNRCKIQNNVSLYKGIILEDGVFCGPSAVFTNVHTPRAEIERKDEFRSTYIERGATIGANATIVCGNRLGAYCLIGAGAVVTKDVKPHALMVGCPARQIGWVSHAGEKLGKDLICPREGRVYKITSDNTLEEVTVQTIASA